jgi:hypothetical protein
MTRGKRFCGRVQVTYSGDYWNDVVDCEPLLWGESGLVATLIGPPDC